MVVCKMEDGQTFDATPKMSHAEREQLLIDKDIFIGKMAEIRFFEFTDKGIPRHGRFIGERLDK